MSTTTDALATALDSENAAIFTYGVMTAYVASARRSMLEEYIAAHRKSRDALSGALTTAGASVPAAAPGYTLPIAVTDPVSAAKVALAAEIDCTVAYRALLERGADAASRTLGVDGLTAGAERAAQWRLALGEKPATVALPGRR